MTEEQKQKLVALFEEQKTSEDDQAFWFTRLSDASPVLCESVIEMFALFPGEMGQLRGMQERKEQALASGDMDAWGGIVEDETRRLAALA
ncbi:hypothetical protein HY416_00540 [Candidatus Kaiserbacteria bacterium]|nr:hypothetical protein [Candidatus Kaiserbacteria bacterium]